MNKVSIIIEKLGSVGIKYLGLPISQRKALLDAMEEYANDKSKPLARVLITENCRKTHGVEGAFNEACERLKENYMMFTETPINKNITWTIELNTSKE